MKQRMYTKTGTIAIFIGILMLLTSPCLSDDLKKNLQEPRGRYAALKFTEKLSVSYDGASKIHPAPRQPVDTEYVVVRHAYGVPANPVLGNKDEFYWVKDKMASLTRQFLKYFSFEEELDTDESGLFHLERKTNAYTAVTGEFDINLSFGIRDLKDLSVSSIKVSSYGFATCLGAIYDTRDNGFDLFISNSHINTILLEGMKLEFHIRPNDSVGAFLLTMPF